MIPSCSTLQNGIIKVRPDVFKKYNLRSKIDFRINKWARLSNNTTFYASTYDFPGISDPEDSFASGGRHAMACFTPQNGDFGGIYHHQHVVVDGKLITARAMAASIDYGLKLVEVLGSVELCQQVKERIYY